MRAAKASASEYPGTTDAFEVPRRGWNDVWGTVRMGMGREASGGIARGARCILAPVLCSTQSGSCSWQARQRPYRSFHVQMGIVF